MKNAAKNKTKVSKAAPVKPVKVAKPAVVKEPKVKTVPRGNNMFLTEAEWAKVDKKRGDVSFSAWSRSLVQAAIK